MQSFTEVKIKKLYAIIPSLGGKFYTGDYNFNGQVTCMDIQICSYVPYIRTGPKCINLHKLKHGQRVHIYTAIANLKYTQVYSFG